MEAWHGHDLVAIAPAPKVEDAILAVSDQIADAVAREGGDQTPNE